MQITSLTTASLQALYLKTGLGTSGTTGTTTSSWSLGDSTDVLDLSSVAQWASRTQVGNPFQMDFENLGTLINGGDLTGAASAYAAMQAKMQAGRGDGGDMAKDFAAVGSALEKGDLSGAQSAWQALQSRMEAMEAGRGAHGRRHGMKEDMDQLGQLLANGDLSGAQSLFKTMQERMANRPEPEGERPPKREDMKSAFEGVGSALNQGDLAAAKSAWSSLQELLESRAPRRRDPSETRTSSAVQVSELDILLISASFGNPMGSSASS